VAFGPAVSVRADAADARWIAPELGTFGTVGGLVPRGYERCVLLDYRGGEPLGWDGVCLLFEQLVPVLARHTSTPDRCWFAIWEGYGFDTSTTLVAVMPQDDEGRRELEHERQRLREDDAQRNRAIRLALRGLPSFDLPHRRYYLVRGAVTAASQLMRPDGDFPQPPDLWWPADRGWFVGGDTDLDWCYIAGSERLVSAVRAEFPGRTRVVDRNVSNAAAGE
jgi:hypothetical protein